MSDLIKQRFVGCVLREQGELMLSRQGAAMRKRLKFKTGNLLDQRKLVVSEGNDVMDGSLKLTHVDYERFLDIRGRRKAGSKKTRAFKIHNRFVMGAYYAIARELYGLTEEVRAGLKGKLGNNSSFNI